MKKRENNFEKHPFQFVLYINKKKKLEEGKEPPIICQRYFPIRDYNPEVLNSIELKELMDELIGVNNNGVMGSMGVIPNFLKQKSYDFMWSMYNEHYKQTEADIPQYDIWAKEDEFTFEIKVDEKVVADGHFSGNLFPTKVRYHVNIKDIIPEIMGKIRETFSMGKYEQNYESYNLNYLKELEEEYSTLVSQ
jgi:hypothetical protein